MNHTSALKLHPSAIFCLDEEAASELTLADGPATSLLNQQLTPQ